MGYKLNDAFAGVHDAPDGTAFAIGYRDKAALAPFNVGRPPGHAQRYRIGWYWHNGSILRGPFTSSRLAYQDAMAALAKKPKVA